MTNKSGHLAPAKRLHTSANATTPQGTPASSRVVMAQNRLVLPGDGARRAADSADLRGMLPVVQAAGPQQAG